MPIGAEGSDIIAIMLRRCRSRQVRHPMFAFLGILAAGTVFFSLVEDWRWLDALYFCVSTVTMLGYGDIAPQTDVGKIGTMFYAVTGIAVFLMLMERLVLRRDVEQTVHEAESDIRAAEDHAGAGTRPV